METCMNHFVKTSKTSKNFKNYKNPNFRTDFGTKIYQIFKLKFGLVPRKRVSSNNLRKSGAPFDLSLTSGSLLRNDIIVNSVFSPESAHAQYCFHICSSLFYMFDSKTKKSNHVILIMSFYSTSTGAIHTMLDPTYI